MIPAALIYVFRSWFVFTDIGLVCLASIVIIGLSLIIGRAILLTKSLPLIGLCILSLLISSLAPHPEPEQIHLRLFRSEYESVIELARNHELGHEGICEYAYVLPDEYANLSIRKHKCIIVEYEPALVVVFEPLFYRKLLVYAENSSAVRSYISCGGSDAIGYYQLEENWYKCFQDPN